MWNKIQRIYVWNNLVYPNPIVFDFTTWDNWFTYYSAHSNVTHGRDSNWLRAYNPSNSYKACAWTMPSSLKSNWNPKKIEFTLKSTRAWWWWGICVWLDTSAWRTWLNRLERYYNWDYIDNITTTPANTEYTFTIDLVNKYQYVSYQSSTKQTIPDWDITQILSKWDSWDLNICAMITNTPSTYSYIKMIKFYF